MRVDSIESPIDYQKILRLLRDDCLCNKFSFGADGETGDFVNHSGCRTHHH